MLSRQIYAYSMGYALTGDTSLLAHAKAGVDWLIGHAIDKEKGGCFEQLNADGSAVAPAAPDEQVLLDRFAPGEPRARLACRLALPRSRSTLKVATDYWPR